MTKTDQLPAIVKPTALTTYVDAGLIPTLIAAMAPISGDLASCLYFTS